MPRKKVSESNRFEDVKPLCDIYEDDVANELASLSLPFEIPAFEAETDSSGTLSTSPSSGLSDNSSVATLPSRRSSGNSDVSNSDSEYRSIYTRQVQMLGSTLTPCFYNYQLTVPKRGGPGSQGRIGKAVIIFANHFPLKIRAGSSVNHYDVDVKTP